MKLSKPPTVATWLLQHFCPGSQNDHIVGDLVEGYQSGRSRAWYWREVLAAIIIGVYDETITHPWLAIRAVSIGWATWFLFHFAVGPGLLGPFVRRFFAPSGYPFSAMMLIWWTASMFVRAASGWIVARLHSSHRIAMVLLLAASVFVVQLWTLPWIWFETVNTLTNVRFLPYLIYMLELQILWPAAVLFGGLLYGSPRTETVQREQHSAL